MLKYHFLNSFGVGLAAFGALSVVSQSYAGGSDSLDYELRRLDAKDAQLERRIDVVEDDVHSLKGGQASYNRPTHRSSYVVRTGDSLWGLARKFQVSPQSIKQVNRLSVDTIFVGQQLEIPGQTGVAVSASTRPAPQIYNAAATSSGSYIVRTGDTARSIARAHGLDLATLGRMNGLKDLNYIQVAQRLNVTAANPRNVTTTVAAAPKKVVKSQGPPAGWKPKADRALAKTKPAQVDVWAPEPLPEPLVPVIPEQVMPSKPKKKVAKKIAVIEDKVVEAAPAPAPVEEKKKESYLSYEFQQGDTLEKVAETFGTSVSKLLKINSLPASYKAKAKDRILVPTAGVFFDVAGLR